ncbi:hypothetical protein ACTPGW_002618 [Enterococcus faecalis]
MKNADINLNIELIRSVRNLLESDVSNKEIAETCKLSNKTVSDLRTNKKPLETVLFSTMSNLYFLSKSKKLDVFSQEEEKQKGTYSALPLQLDVKQIFVSFEKEDTFLNGFMVKQEVSKPNELTRLDEPQAVFLLDSGELVNAWEVGYKFLCRYGGTAPNEFLRTLTQYSRIPEHKLQEIIFHSSSVLYDVKEDTIKGLTTVSKERKFDLFSYQGKLIITLKYLENELQFRESNELRGGKKKEVTMDFVVDEIIFFREKLKEKYNYQSEIKKVKYINDAYDEKGIAQLYQSDSIYSHSNDFKIIIEFDDYELWIPYDLWLSKKYKGDVFETEEMNILLSGLGISYDNESMLKKWKTVSPISEISLK